MIGWRVATAADLPDHDRWLGPHERSVLAGLRFERRRADWRLGRWTAKHALGSVAFEIRAAPDGAPEVWRDGEPAPHTLSISHAGGTGFAAVGPVGLALGCDVEVVEARSDRFVDDYLTAAEAAWVRAAADPALAANLVWSAKESVLKLLREGLRVDTRRVGVTVDDVVDGAWRTLRAVVDDAALVEGRWRAEGGLVFTVVSRPFVHPR